MAFGVNPANKTVNQIFTKFTIINDPNNQRAERNIIRQQQRISRLRIQDTKITDKRFKLNKKWIRQEQQLREITNRNTVKYKELIASQRKVKDDLRVLSRERKLNNKLIKDAEKDLNNLNTAYKQNSYFISKAQAATWGYTAALTALGGTIFEGIKLNIQYIENLNVIEQLFGSNTDAVIDWAISTRNSFGLARTSALQYVATLKAFTKSAGINDMVGTGISVIGVQLAADLASFRNVSFDTAFRAIVSGLAGISRTLRYNFGIDIGDEAIKERFGSVGSTQKEKIIQRFILLLERSSFVVGDFSRTKNSPANQIRLLRENFKEFSFLITQSLLPMVNFILILLNKILGVLVKTQQIIVVVGGALAISNLVNGIFKGGFLKAFTLGRRGIGGVFFGLLQSFLALALIGKFLPNISESAIEAPQESTSYLPDLYNIDENGQISGNGVTINIAGDATTQTVEEMAYEAKKMRFKGVR